MSLACCVLTTLAAQGWRHVILSNHVPELPALVEALGLGPVVEFVVTSALVGVKKPHPRIYELACTRLGVQPKDCRYVGDGGSSELTGAAAMGMSAVLLRVPEELDEGTYRAGTDDWHGPTVSTLGQVLCWLEP